MSVVLFVCTANQCRSPIAEALFRRIVSRAELGWQVVSAGTRVTPGTSYHQRAVEALSEHGVTLCASECTPVSNELIDTASLILTATHAHARQILLSRPRAARRTFVLGQFANLLSHAPSGDCADSPDGLASIAGRSRVLVQPRPPEMDDTKDPIHGGLGAFRSCVSRTAELLEPLSQRLSATVVDAVPPTRA